MITHVVLVQTKDGADEAQVQRLLSEAKNKLTNIPGVQNLSSGVVFRSNKTYNVGLCMYFEDEEALNNYIKHPVHLAYVEDPFKQVAADYLTADFHG